MALFSFKWLRILVRRHTNPIEVNKARVWKQRISIGYALVAWNACGYVLYMVFSGKADWAKDHGLKTEEELQLTPAQQWTKTLGIKDATVYRVSGFKVTKYEVHNEIEEKKQKGLPKLDLLPDTEAEESK